MQPDEIDSRQLTLYAASPAGAKVMRGRSIDDPNTLPDRLFFPRGDPATVLIGFNREGEIAGVWQATEGEYGMRGTDRSAKNCRLRNRYKTTWRALLPGRNDLARSRGYREIGLHVGTRPEDAAVFNLAPPRHRIRHMAAAVLVLMLTLSTQSSAQTPTREGNESDFKDWQPTQGQVSAEERAAGVRQSPAQRNAEDHELKQIDQSLMRNEQPSSSTAKPGAPP
jgi:hypothetical protein